VEELVGMSSLEILRVLLSSSASLFVSSSSSNFGIDGCDCLIQEPEDILPLSRGETFRRFEQMPLNSLGLQ